MKALEEEWQYQWHLNLSLDTENMESDIDCDFRMHFDIWQAEPEVQKQCFSLFEFSECTLDGARKARKIVSDSSSCTNDHLAEMAREHAT